MLKYMLIQCKHPDRFPNSPEPSTRLPGLEDSKDIQTTHSRFEQHVWLLQVIFPAMRIFLKPARQRATDGSVVELTRLEKLYKIFERC